MNKLYYNSPIFLQHFYTSLYGYRLKSKRYNKIYQDSLSKLKSEVIDPGEQLSNLLNHLKKNVEFYKNICIDETAPLSTLLNLTMTEKEDLRTELELRSYKTVGNRVGKTGGTTGKSLKYYTSKKDRAQRMAYLDYIKLINGVVPFSKRASFTGKEITPDIHKNVLWRYNLPMNQILYASFKMKPNNIQYVFNNMRKNKVATIDGFPSTIHLVAKYILSNNIKIDWDIKAIFPTAETLTENMKEDIEKAFDSIVIDQYASSEGAPFLYSLVDGSYKIGHETGLFEFFRVEHNVYEMVVTSFINYATPIVRYKIGDRVQLESNSPYLNSFEDQIIISKILGRGTDYLIGENKNMVTSANMSNTIKELGDMIIQSQFIQKDIGYFKINLVVTKKYDESKDEKVLISKLNHRLGSNNEYVFNYLEEIPKEKSGKTRFIINEMSDA